MDAAQRALAREVARRRTFAIISHPDAGKTTLTEKLLLYGGAVREAGAVRAQKAARYATSDWLAIEKQRGISVSSSVLQFEHHGARVNLLDTPGHRDFSEDTYRTLVAADAAVMLIDAAKGVEAQTRKLFEVCRLRHIPIFTFVNKMDRQGREPLELLSEIEEVLGIDAVPMNWPIGMGSDFRGVYDRIDRCALLFEGGHHGTLQRRRDARRTANPTRIRGCAKRSGRSPRRSSMRWRCSKAPAQSSTPRSSRAACRLRRSSARRSPTTACCRSSTASSNWRRRPARARRRAVRSIPSRTRSRASCSRSRRTWIPTTAIASRSCGCARATSCAATPRMHVRTGKPVRITRSTLLQAQEREIVDEAFPGDVVGLFDPGIFRIGDTLSNEGDFAFEGIPSFSPEHFARVEVALVLNRKALAKGLSQLSQEGVVQIFSEPGSGSAAMILGAVGPLQFEVLQHRLQAEYGVALKLTPLPYQIARWPRHNFDAEAFRYSESVKIVEDRDHHPVLLFRAAWNLDMTRQKYPDLELAETGDAAVPTGG